MSRLTRIITASDPSERNRSLDEAVSNLPLSELMAEAAALDQFRRESENLYERVRALFFLYAIHRFHVPARSAPEDAKHTARAEAPRTRIPFKGFEHLLQ